MKKFKRSKASRKEPEHKKRKLLSKQTIWAAGIVIIMVLSVIGFMYVAPSESEYEYGGVTFTPVVTGSNHVDHWFASVNGARISFYNHPYDVEFINLTDETKGILSSSNVFYLTSDPEDRYKEEIALLNYYMSEDLGRLGFIFVTGFTANNTFGKPVITCENATADMPVLYYVSGRNDSITHEGNCIKIRFSTQMTSRRFTDRVNLVLLGLEG